MKLNLMESGLAAFSDASSSFCHDKELGMLTDRQKMLSRLGVTSGVDRNYMLSFGQRYPQKLWELQNFLRRGQVVGVAINGKVAWIQYLGRERQKIIKTLWACTTNAMKYTDDQLLVGELRDLAKIW